MMKLGLALILIGLGFKCAAAPFFFFQAEDGIRDRTVTGVQTCALPIYPRRGIVSMKRGLSAESPKTTRSFRMAVLMPSSKLTKVSAGQRLACNSSRVTISPGRSSSIASTRKGCSCSGTFLPFLCTSPEPRSTSKSPARTRRPKLVGASINLHPNGDDFTPGIQFRETNNSFAHFVLAGQEQFMVGRLTALEPWVKKKRTGCEERSMKPRILIFVLVVFATGCSSTKNAGSGPTTSMPGTWTVTGNLGSQGGGSSTYQVSLVSSPCSVTTPVGMFSVQGPVCFTANNNSGQGSISGTGIPTSTKSTGQGVLLGVAANPVPANGTFNLIFVAGDASGVVVEFTGSGTVSNGTMTGTGSCSSSTPVCQGISGTFSGTLQQ